MKRLIYSGFLFALMLVVPGVAMAKIDNGVVNLTNGNSYGCGDEDGVTVDYADGTYLQVVGDSEMNGTHWSIHQRYLCSASTGNPFYDDYWKRVGTNWCPDSELRQPGIANADYCLYGNGSLVSCTSGAAPGGCIKATCSEGYEVANGVTCVKKSAGSDGGSGGGSGSGSGGGSGGGSGRGSGGGSGGASAGGSGVGSSSRNTNVNAQREASCKNSGGRWSNKKCICDDAFGLTMGGDDYTCRCKNGYEWKNSADKAQGCQMTSIEVNKKKCESAAAQYKTSWTGTDCLCPNDAQGRPQEFDYTLVKCVMGAKIAQCEKVQGAVWNNLSGECVCVQPNFVINAAGTACEESSASKEKREATELAKTKGKIKTAYDAIGALSNAKKTVWRDEEGEFNTARLASDSIAGVVLGTTGALVTSHLVKKKQTEDGFEDIQCTIGGQTVAGWGDEFSVGINK